jgi:hypothetical protein
MKANKIQMGIFQDGKLVSTVLNAVDANNATIATMNVMAGILDKQYQDIKQRDGVIDSSYIAFDYLGAENGYLVSVK